MVATTKFIWDEDNYLEETDGANSVQAVYTNEPMQYGNLISQRSGSTTSYCHFDGLGSIRQLTTVAAATSDTFLYTAWGEEVARDGTTMVGFRWIGEIGYYVDLESSSHYIRARHYIADTGRFTTVDPRLTGPGWLPGRVLLKGSSAAPNDNPYVYADGSPIIAIDPSGLACHSQIISSCFCQAQLPPLPPLPAPPVEEPPCVYVGHYTRRRRPCQTGTLETRIPGGSICVTCDRQTNCNLGDVCMVLIKDVGGLRDFTVGCGCNPPGFDPCPPIPLGVIPAPAQGLCLFGKRVGKWCVMCPSYRCDADNGGTCEPRLDKAGVPICRCVSPVLT